MAYDLYLAERVRLQLAMVPNVEIYEKKMFGGIAFMVNDKMCINITKDRLMCRYDPGREEEVSLRTGFQLMKMRGKTIKGYCYVNADGFEDEEALNYWVELCLEFNPRAKISKKRKK